MKLLALIQGFHVAASRYRLLQYLPFFHHGGVEAEVLQFPRGPSGWLAARQRLAAADVIFVQRRRPGLPALLFLHHLGKPLVYDFDDAVMFRDSFSGSPYSRSRLTGFRTTLRFTDLVVAGNSFLAEQARKYHGNVRILPTAIDLEKYPQKTYEKREGVTIGWIGDHVTLRYVERYREVWEEIGRRYPHVVLSIISDEFIEGRSIRVVKRQWSAQKEVEYLSELDIGLMPLVDDPWSRGKCGLKIIQYLGVGVPAVCTPVGINRDVVEPGRNGFWASTGEEWVDALSRLIENPAMREEMGWEGRRRVTERYTLQVCGPRLVEWLKEAVQAGGRT